MTGHCFQAKDKTCTFHLLPPKKKRKAWKASPRFGENSFNSFTGLWEADSFERGPEERATQQAGLQFEQPSLLETPPN